MIPSNVRYVTRPLAQVLRQCPSKVAVLEGARAVGKTMLVQTELPDGYHYETLADKRTFEYASSHLDEWVDSLPTPCIIDEAQRIPDLPLSVKGVIDKQTGSTPFFHSYWFSINHPRWARRTGSPYPPFPALHLISPNTQRNQ